MSESRLATLCLSTSAECSFAFRRCLDRFLDDTPPCDIELRLGLPSASPSLHYALGRLCPDGRALEHARLPQNSERFRGSTPDGRSFVAWGLPSELAVEAALHWLWCDVPLSTDYVIWLNAAAPLSKDWWRELASLLRQEVDVVGPPAWSDFLPEEANALRAAPWYQGIPLLSRAGQPGWEHRKTAGQHTASLRSARRVCWMQAFGGMAALNPGVRFSGWPRWPISWAGGKR